MEGEVIDLATIGEFIAGDYPDGAELVNDDGIVVAVIRHRREE